MKKIIIQLVTCVFFVSISLIPLRADDTIPEFTIMTELWIPYQFEQDGQTLGISVDIMVLMLEKISSKQKRDDISIYPWARGYQTALHQNGTILFLTTRTKEREKLFKWVGPLFTNTTCLISRKDRNITITSPDDFNKFLFGAVRDDVGEQLLIREGVPLAKIKRTTSNTSTTKMLQAGRLDFIAQSYLGFSYDARAAGLNPDNFECSYELNSDDISYAFHKETPDAIIEKFQRAFDQLKKEGKVQEIFKRYQDQLEVK